jgi:hypothetical protein
VLKINAMKLDYYRWNYEKNLKLKAERGISFEQVVMHIERGDILDVVQHPNQEKYPNQQIIIVDIDNYAYLIPFVEDENGKYLKTIIPSRKATRNYLGGKE